MSTQYHTDFVAWADETAKLLRQHRFEEIDLDALVEEIEGLAKRDRKAMKTVGCPKEIPAGNAVHRSATLHREG